MKAITIKPLWAYMILTGQKKFELRAWKPSVTDLLLHVSASISATEKRIIRAHDFPLEDIQSLCGMIVARFEVGSVTRVEPRDDFEIEREAGFTLTDKAVYAWRIKNLVRMIHRVPAKGKLGLWDWQQPE